MRYRLLAWSAILGLLLIACSTVPATATGTGHTVEQILALDKAPDGVIFEIVTSKADSLQWALPLVKREIERLQNRFPKLNIAVVTHGNEQFALQKNHQKKNTEIHSLTRDMVKQGVPVHVCGTYAGMKGVTEEEFAGHVNVAASGPAQINDYIAVGYLLVKITARNRPAAGQ